MSRILKATTAAMLVIAASVVALAAPPATAGTEPIRKIAVPHTRLNWVPARTGTAFGSPRVQTSASATIQTFSASVKDGASTFRYRMVGKNPFVAQAQPRSTIATTVIPVVIKFSNGDTWDPRVIDSCDSQSALTRTLKSPIFVAQAWKFGATPVGTGQYVDAFRRGEFYRQTKPTGINPGYHVTLAPTTHAPLVLNVPTNRAAESTTVCGTHKLGAVEIDYLDAGIQSYITRTLGAGATATFPLFVLGNVVEFIGSPGECCVLGYHNAIPNAGRMQTYGVAMYDNTGDFRGSADTTVLSHEVAEWMDDPFVDNPTKPWGNIGQVSGCQENLEVGDPLSGTAITDAINQKNYHLQELAFFSWFYHSSPSLGVNGWFSTNGTLKASARPCAF